MNVFKGTESVTKSCFGVDFRFILQKVASTKNARILSNQQVAGGTWQVMQHL